MLSLIHIYGNLVEIRHNTDGNAANDVVYSFEQDALGRQTAVKVGNQILSQSAYPVSYTHLDVYKRQGWNTATSVGRRVRFHTSPPSSTSTMRTI